MTEKVKLIGIVVKSTNKNTRMSLATRPSKGLHRSNRAVKEAERALAPRKDHAPKSTRLSSRLN